MKLKKVAIRGTGLLARRIMATMARTQDMKVTAVIAKADPTLTRLIESGSYGGQLTQAATPNCFFLSERERVMEELRRKYSHISFRPLSELNLAETSEVIIDTAPSDHGSLGKQYGNYPGYIIAQDGAYPWGHLIASPVLTTTRRENRWRQGGCVLSGVAPVLAAFKDLITDVRLTIVMQDDSRGDYFITERTNTFRTIDLPRVEEELRQLFPDLNIVIENILQIPGMLHYALMPVMKCRTDVSTEDIKKRLTFTPRVRLIPSGITSTHDLNLTRSTDASIPPITVFEESIKDLSVDGEKLIKLVVALHYPLLAVLPNLDAIRILVDGMDPLKAMLQTDRDMGFVQ